MLYGRRAGFPALLFWRIAVRYLLIPLLALVVACSNISPGTAVEEEKPVSLLTGKSGGTKLSDFGSQNRPDSSMPVNAIAWRAALDIASLVPLADVDTFSGTVVTEWYSLADRPNERIKLTIFVVGRELRSDSITVRVHVQQLMDGGWGETVRDQALARQIEDLILARARELRAESLSEIAD